MSLDRTDHLLLAALQHDARTPHDRLADKIGTLIVMERTKAGLEVSVAKDG